MRENIECIIHVKGHIATPAYDKYVLYKYEGYYW